MDHPAPVHLPPNEEKENYFLEIKIKKLKTNYYHYYFLLFIRLNQTHGP